MRILISSRQSELLAVDLIMAAPWRPNYETNIAHSVIVAAGLSQVKEISSCGLSIRKSPAPAWGVVSAKFFSHRRAS